MPRNDLHLVPWERWSQAANPEWWKNYNGVKHRRDEEFKRANLGNVLYSMAGLIVLVGYLYAEDLRDSVLPNSQSFLRFAPK